MKKNLITIILLTLFVRGVSQFQTHVNRVFQTSSASPLFNPVLNPLGVQWSNSIKCSTGGIINVGYTSISGQGQNIYVIKYDESGNIVFQYDFNSSGNNNDYGTAIYEASNGDFLVCGTTDNGVSMNYDVVVLRINNTGSLLYSDIQNGSSSLNDVATSITEDNSGNVFVAASSEVTNGNANFWVLKYTASLSLAIANNYDYVGLNDIALGLEINNSTGIVSLIGPSASGITSCDYAMANFNTGNLGFVSDARSSISGTVLDQALAFCKDGSNNTYITGKTWNGINFDIKTIKFTSSFALAWTDIQDPHGFEDAGNAITVDGSGNIIIGGYSTKNNNLKELICFKYDSTGTLLWQYRQSSANSAGNAAIKKMCANPITDDIYIVGSEKSPSGVNRVLTGKISPVGKLVWQRTIEDGALNILPSDIKYDTDGIYVISVLDSVTDSYITTKFTELTLDTAKRQYGKACYKKNELIVRFLPTALDSAVIDNRVGSAQTDFGDLKNFMMPAAYATATNALHNAKLDYNIKAVKIFPGHATTFSTTTSHLAETIAVTDFWTALLLVLPDGSDVEQYYSILNNLTSIAAYAHPNWMAQLYSAPNDSLYDKQYSIHTNTTYPGCDVNASEAWEVIPNGGKPFVRCGIFDTSIDWEHKDFDYDGLFAATSKIIAGWIIGDNTDMKSVANGFTVGNSHGTSVTGIIGGQRNNTVGIAGIAGGNDSTGSRGIGLYGLGIFDTDGGPVYSPVFAPLTYIADAIWFGSNSPSITGNSAAQNYCYDVHLQNHSWGLYAPPSDTGYYTNFIQSNMLFSEAMHMINRKKVTAVAARGNDGTGVLSYPANVDDDWVINVTGSGIDGKFAHDNPAFGTPLNAEFTSSWGGDVDLCAPASGSLIMTLRTPTIFGPIKHYGDFGGTSAAAPHVTGAVGLMMSYMNDTTGAANYQNLAPEDCEAILQLAATDVDSVGYDQLTGHGRLNIGKAMKLLERPCYQLLHFGTHSPTTFSMIKTVQSASDTIILAERYQRKTSTPPVWFQKGRYVVKTYKVISTLAQGINSLDTVIAYWPRSSSAITFPPFINGKLTPREKTKFFSFNNSYAALEGYVYQVKDTLGNSLGWWPVDTGYVGNTTYGHWAEYSVLTKNCSRVYEGIDEKTTQINNVSIFPNPSAGGQSLVIETNGISDLNIDLYDLMGRKIRTVFRGKTNQGKTTIIHDVSSLPNSLYIYSIIIDGEHSNKKFVKQ